MTNNITTGKYNIWNTITHPMMPVVYELTPGCFSVGVADGGCHGAHGWSNIAPAPGAEDAEPVFLIPVGLPCLERGRLYKKMWLDFSDRMRTGISKLISCCPHVCPTYCPYVNTTHRQSIQHPTNRGCNLTVTFRQGLYWLGYGWSSALLNCLILRNLQATRKAD